MLEAVVRTISRRVALLWVAGGLVLAGACVGDSPIMVGDEILCDVDQDLLRFSLPPNQIRALTLPAMVEITSPEAGYLFDEDRVLGVYVNGEARAYPHNILWRHEIVNDQIGGQWVSVSFCPLTGSGLAFDPNLGGERLDLGVSGFLFANNLVMYDRITAKVYGPQLGVEALCQGYVGQELTLIPVQEMSWGRWKALHPDTKVVTGNTGFGLNYRVYPYDTYDQLSDNTLLFDMPVDASRPIKERTLVVRVGDGGRGFPFGELNELGSVAVVNEVIGGVPTVILYDAANGETALAFDARVGAQTLTFDADPSGTWTDQETGTTWALDGTAIAGQLVGERLATRADAYTAMWFAWRHFQPNGSTFLN